METFHVPGFYVKNQGILSVYGSGRGCAVTVNIGDGATQIFVIYEGTKVESICIDRFQYVLFKKIQKMAFKISY